MRVSIKGKRPVSEVREILMDAIDRLDRLGIEFVSGTNFYFNPMDSSGEEIEIVNADGDPITGWTVPAPKKTKKAKSAEVVRLAIDNENN